MRRGKARGWGGQGTAVAYGLYCVQRVVEAVAAVVAIP